MSVDDLFSDWTQQSGSLDKLLKNYQLLKFLSSWLFDEYQPFPEKPEFWDRLYLWLDQIDEHANDRAADQQAMFNFVPYLLFAGERDLTSMYRSVFDRIVQKWLIDKAEIDLQSENLDNELEQARRSTWFGSLAGMDINTFCRVNGIFGQSYRPEFRFISEFCDIPRLADWLEDNEYSRVVIVEDVVGTGEQFSECIEALTNLQGFDILFVPLFIPPLGDEFVSNELATAINQHIEYEPFFVLPSNCILESIHSDGEPSEFTAFRTIVQHYGDGDFGLGDEYGTLALSYLNCPDNVPKIIRHPTEVALFPRASREG